MYSGSPSYAISVTDNIGQIVSFSGSPVGTVYTNNSRTNALSDITLSCPSCPSQPTTITANWSNDLVFFSRQISPNTIFMFWNPLFTGMDAQENKADGSTINILAEDESTVTRNIDIESEVEITLESEYTGNVGWQLVNKDNTLIYQLTSHNPLIVSAKDLLSHLTSNEAEFRIRALKPHFTNNSGSFTLGYIPYKSTQPLKIVPKKLEVDNISCKSADVRIKEPHSTTTIIYEVCSAAGNTWYTIGNTVTSQDVVTITKEQVETYVDPSNFRLKAVYYNTSIDYSEIVTVNILPPLSSATVKTEPYCDGDTDLGRIKITRGSATTTEIFQLFPEGSEVSPKSVTLNAGSLEGYITKVDGGTYYVLQSRVVNDFVQCQEEFENLEVKVLSNPAFEKATPYSVSCPDKNNGFIDFTLTNPNNSNNDTLTVGSINYIINNSNSTIDYTVSNLAAHNYQITITDDHGCKSTINREIENVDPVTFSVDSVKPSCTGYSDGQIILRNLQGGATYLDDAAEVFVNGVKVGNWLNSAESFSAGTNFNGTSQYSVYITKKGGAFQCTSNTVIKTIGDPPELLFDPVNPYDTSTITCPGSRDGEIRLYHNNGGTGTKTFHLTAPSMAISQDKETGIFDSDIGADTYDAWITDINGCSSGHETITLTGPPPIVFFPPDFVQATCKGTQDGSIHIEVTGGTKPYSYQWKKFNGDLLPLETSNTISNLDSGIFKFEVLDFNNCPKDTSPVILASPHAINFNFTRHPSCAIGDSGGMIILKDVLYGKPPYSYVFNGQAEQPAGSEPVYFRDLAPGVYSFEVRDNNYLLGDIYAEKCKTSKNIQIERKPAASVTAGLIEPLCFGDSNGRIEVSGISGPDSPFVLAWRNEQNDSVGTGNLLSGISRGGYTALIRDSMNCEVRQEFLLNEPSELEFTSIETEDAACEEIHDGKITISASGGISPLRYSIDGGTHSSTLNYFEGQARGVYPLQVLDDHSCTADTTIEIGAFKPLLSLTNTDSVHCAGEANGSLLFNANGSKTGNFSYMLNVPGLNLSNTTGLFSGLATNDYKVWAFDDKGCYTDTLTEEVAEPDPLGITLSLLDSASCGQYTGKIDYNITGGNGGYNLVWYNPEFGETDNLDILSLKSGDYTLTVQDWKECSETSSINIPDRPAPEITGFNILSRTWCELPLGSVRVNAESGSPAYRYRWSSSDNDTLDTADSLRHGTYSVTVTDRYNCYDIGSVTLTDGPALTPSSYVDDAHCGQNDGSAEITVSGGVPPYRFQWPDSIASNEVSDPVMNNLFAGDYSVAVLDTVGCSLQFTVLVNDLDGPSISSVEKTKSWCGLAHGTAGISVINGTPPYTYAWRYADSSGVIGTKASITDLLADNYIVRVTDDVNCRTSSTVQITDSLELQPVLDIAGLDSAACSQPVGSLSVLMSGGLAPYHYQWETNENDTLSELANITRGTYRVTATDTRGCLDSLTLNLPDRKAPKIYLLGKENAYCGKATGSASVYVSLGMPPYYAYLSNDPLALTSLSWADSLGMYAGIIDSLLPDQVTYNIRVKDRDGCGSNRISTIIGNNDPMTLILSDISPVSCYGGSDGRAVVLVSGGFEPYSYEWSEHSVDSAVNHSLTAGVFSVTATDSKECVKTLQVTSTPITQPSPLQISSFLTTDPLCYGSCDGSIIAYAEGGNSQYTYIWDNKDTLQHITGLCAGDHILNVIDSKGCTFPYTFYLDDPPLLTGTDLPEEMNVCAGQIYKADPGDKWNNVTWTSDNGYTSHDRVAQISEPGNYYLQAYSDIGCAVYDTFTLYVSENLLDADFLMMSEVNTGDTVVLIDVSWPLPDEITWLMPEEAEVKSDHGFYKELVFNKPGTYYVELTATLAQCVSIKGKYIEVLETEPDNTFKETHEEEAFITEFNVYPNPARENLNMHIELAAETNVRVELINITSNKLSDVAMGYGLNEYELSVNISDLMPGMYLVRLIAKDHVQTKMLVVR